MSDFLNRLLRPFIKFFFNNIYPRIPFHQKILWFFCKRYFVEGFDPVSETWNPLLQKLRQFTKNDYRVLLNDCTEDAASLAEAARTRDVYCEFTDLIRAHNLQKNVSLSIKMSQFGCFSPDTVLASFGFNTTEDVVRYARQRDVSAVFDGERLTYAPVVKMFVYELARKHRNVGIRLQAYDQYFKEETMWFVQANIKIKIIIPLSVCKGAYDEPKMKTMSGSATRSPPITKGQAAKKERWMVLERMAFSFIRFV